MSRKRKKISLAQPIRPRERELNKLFSTTDDTEQASGLHLLAIRLDAIQPDPKQPRRSFPRESIAELAESVRHDGVIQPIEVAQLSPDHYMIVHGERRWRAATEAGLETIPAVVRRTDYDGLTRFVRQLVENIQREDLNDMDRAAGITHLRELMQREEEESAQEEERKAKAVSLAQVGKRLGYSRQRIHQLMQLLKLPEEIRDAIRDGKLSERDSRLYQGLEFEQQLGLHRIRYESDHELSVIVRVAEILKSSGASIEAALKQASKEGRGDDPTVDTGGNPRLKPDYVEKGVRRSGGTKPSSLERLDFVRGHLARIQRSGLSVAEREKIVARLNLVRADVNALLNELDR